MRLWSLDPTYLDGKGLVAGWREALLAQKVLAGATHGYRQHPQLVRFREADQPREAMSAFLRGLHREATARGYSFDVEKIVRGPLLAGERELAQPGPDWPDASIPVGSGESGSGAARSSAEAEEPIVPTIPVTQGQLDYEAQLLIFKLRMRAPALVESLADDQRAGRLKHHPLFSVVPGEIESWEKVREDL